MRTNQIEKIMGSDGGNFLNLPKLKPIPEKEEQKKQKRKSPKKEENSIQRAIRKL